MKKWKFFPGYNLIVIKKLKVEKRQLLEKEKKRKKIYDFRWLIWKGKGEGKEEGGNELCYLEIQ